MACGQSSAASQSRYSRSLSASRAPWGATTIACCAGAQRRGHEGVGLVGVGVGREPVQEVDDAVVGGAVGIAGGQVDDAPGSWPPSAAEWQLTVSVRARREGRVGRSLAAPTPTAAPVASAASAVTVRTTATATRRRLTASRRIRAQSAKVAAGATPRPWPLDRHLLTRFTSRRRMVRSGESSRNRRASARGAHGRGRRRRGLRPAGGARRPADRLRLAVRCCAGWAGSRPARRSVTRCRCCSWPASTASRCCAPWSPGCWPG